MNQRVTATRTRGKGVIKFFNDRRKTGLVRPDDGSDDFYINVANDFSGDRFERGVRVTFSLLQHEDGKRQVVELRRA